MKTIETYDAWNKVKKKLAVNSSPKYYRQGQIWWCSIGYNLGSETYGKGGTFTRPVLVLRKLSNNIFLGIPLSSKTKLGSWYVIFKHHGLDVCALLHQIRILDKKRLVQMMGQVDDTDFSKIKTGFNNLYYS